MHNKINSLEGSPLWVNHLSTWTYQFFEFPQITSVCQNVWDWTISV